MTDAFRHGFVEANGVRLHTVEAGEGPLVILVHGFPELWYSWRFQLPIIAKAGYRAVAIDQRGYGSSSKFWAPERYRIAHLVNDLTGLVGALGEKSAILIGHDWGAPVVWTAAWRHPEIFKAVLGMSVPFSGRAQIALPGNPFGALSPHDIHKAISGPELEFYQIYFGGLGAVIDEIEEDITGWVRDLTWTVSGDGARSVGLSFETDDPVSLIRQSALCVAPGSRMRDRFLTPQIMPEWFTHEDLEVFANALRCGGLSGPLSFYRNLDRNWEDLADMGDKPLVVPAMFIGAEFDVGAWWGREAIARAAERIPNWMGSHEITGAGHWLQQERPEETNALVLDFLKQLRSGA